MTSVPLEWRFAQPDGLLEERVLMSNQRFVVQFDHRTVGVAVRVPGGFMFYASDDRFEEMDGRIFTRARAIERQLKKVSSRQRWLSPLLQRPPLPA